MTKAGPREEQLREQREARFNAEQVRVHAEELLAQQTETMAIKMRGKQQQDESRRAEQAVLDRQMRKKK